MCGISLIVTGVQIDFSSSFNEENGKNSEFCKSLAPEINQIQEPVFTVDDLKAALLRRGPAHLGTQKIFLHAERKNYFKMKENLSILGANSKGYSCPIACHPKSLCSSIESKVVCTYEDRENVTNPVSELHFLGATLQLRGLNPVHQPLKDTYGNLLVYNGEIFGGVHVGSDENDTEILMDALQRCCCCNCHAHRKACYCSENEGHISISEMLSTVKGPWALIYWQARSKTIWFGRDAFGRRSLLVHWPTLDDLRFVLASVSPPLAVKSNSDKLNINSDMDFEVEDSLDASSYWEELSCGVYSIHVDVGEADDLYNETNLVGDVKKHEWTDFLLRKLIKWERTSVDPKFEEFHLCYHPSTMQQHVLLPPFDDGKPSKLGFCGNPVTEQTTSQGDLPNPLMNHLIESSSASIDRGTVQCPDSLSARKVLAALKDSVMRQTTQNTIFQKTLHEAKKGQLFPIALLFSGGLDSMILAALLDQCLNPSYGIDLLNVSFDGQFAPDRISARAGIRELQRISPCRRWNLVEINADLSKLASETMHVISLINPSKTYMDLNIGIALWLAAGGDGWVDEGFCNDPGQVHQFVKYKSEAKILLVGSGADEQCAGYSRHRTKYRQGGWAALEEEMKLDMQRIWKRNLGRDDRCISDNGKEARFPFLDEDVIRTLLEIPLWEVAELDQPVGRGDKKILREVAQLLGLEGAAVLPKRAIQFGSRIARESNRKNFGSNRAANQASAGSVVIH